MIAWLSLFLLALALSLDAFSVGFTYGLRKMRIPLKSMLIIGCCSAFSLIIAMLIGKAVSVFVSPSMLEKIGGIILIVIGTWILYQFFQSDREKPMLTNEKIIFKFEIKSIGLVINILKKPMTADLDQSGQITGLEALLLGIALSMDSFGAGIGAQLLGYSPWFLALAVLILSPILIALGLNAGKYLSRFKWMAYISFIPGLLLITIGVLRL